MIRSFAKLHALGNDFLVMALECESDAQLGALARRLCDRHRGVGADGVVFYRAEDGSEAGRVRARIFNADGGEAEMSGNGVRCLAAFLGHEGALREGTVRIDTPAGPRRLSMRSRAAETWTFVCSMGTPILEPARIPARVGAGPEPAVRMPLSVGAESVEVTLSSMGNPHCSTFWADVARAPFDRLGPALAVHAAFPSGTNVEFIQVLDRHRLRVRFWERGVGPTLASGTGSCAAAVAGMLLGHVDSPVTVETELGCLEVGGNPRGEIALTGPATLICAGSCWADGGSGHP